LYQRAVRLLPGGVNSPVRAFGTVGGTPVFMDHGRGSHLWDVDGREYLDYVCSWGPLILGHAYPAVEEAIVKAVAKGTTFGAPTEVEVELAELVVAALPAVEMVRMVNSGTEATMSAVRLARAYTGRSKVLKFAGCWHGHVDHLLVKAGSSGWQYGAADSAGVPEAFARETLVAQYNDLESVWALVGRHGEDLAAIIVEPVAGNMGVVPPREGFLEGLRAIADESGAVLIFDEVITGFRLALGGAQEYYGVQADLTTLGKIIGGGFPVGAYGGRAEIMQQVSPLGKMVQAGTLSGNPVAMAAGAATLRCLQELKPYASLEEKAARLAEGLRAAAQRQGLAATVNRVGSMLTLFLAEGEITSAADLERVSRPRYAAYFHSMLGQGVALPPSHLEALFLSTAHSETDLELTLAAAEVALQAAARV
jgi:glutamate-1-semialdehyde 2,1-aminomutase